MVWFRVDGAHVCEFAPSSIMRLIVKFQRNWPSIYRYRVVTLFWGAKCQVFLVKPMRDEFEGVYIQSSIKHTNKPTSYSWLFPPALMFFSDVKKFPGGGGFCGHSRKLLTSEFLFSFYCVKKTTKFRRKITQALREMIVKYFGTKLLPLWKEKQDKIQKAPRTVHFVEENQ